MRHFLVRTLVWWLIGYLVVSTVNGILTLGLGMLLEGEHGEAAYDIAYGRTRVAHMLVGVAGWTWAALRLRRSLGHTAHAATSTLAVVGIWVAISVIVDAVLFVGLLADTPAGAPADVFYLDNQPWTSLYYVAVAAGPLLAAAWPARPQVS
ncbi:hypothetical protein ACQP1U_15500 [Actinomycetota bacterium]